MKTNSGIGTPYFYEYELGLVECLNMLYDNDIDYVSFQDPRFQSLDDIVISRNDKLINIQVKNTSEDNNMTFSFFWGKGSEEKSLLNSLMSDWIINYDKIDIEEIRIYSNKKYGTKKRDGYVSFDAFVNDIIPKLKENYSYCGNHEENKTIQEFKKRLESKLGDKAEEFLKLLNFKLTESLYEIIESLKLKLKKLIGTENNDAVDFAFNSLQGKLYNWVTDLRTDYKIYKEDVYAALMETDYKYVYSFSPQTPIFPSRITFAKLVEEEINKKNKIYFINGEPGIGKTNFISYLCTKKDSQIDFRFYTYYPVDKCNNIYSDDFGNYSGRDLWVVLLLQLRKFFEKEKLLYKYSFPLVFNYISNIDLKNMTLKYLEEYKKITGRCNVVIDGIDHAARFNNDWNKTYLAELPGNDEIPDGVKFIIVGQPNYDYPVSLLTSAKKIDMPKLSLDDIKVLLKDINNELIPNENLASIIFKEVGDNTLNVIFSIKEIAKLPHNFTVDDLTNSLKEKKLNTNINNYYEWIYNSFNTNPLVKKMVTIFSYATIKIKISSLKNIFKLTELEIFEAVDLLYPLVCINDLNECFVYHNDVKLFFKAKIINSKWYPIVITELCSMLNVDIELKHNILVDMLINSKIELFKYYDLNYLKECIIEDIPFENIFDEFRKVVNYVLMNKKYEKINILNIYLSTITQMDNIIRYNNNDENLSYQINKEFLLSEVYNYDIYYEYNTIINDMYYCLNNDLFNRCEYLNEKYLINADINYLLNKIHDETNNYDQLLNKTGYICRYFKYNFEEFIFDKMGHSFIEGWISCSKKFPNENTLNFSCMTSKYYPDLISEYINYVIKNDNQNVYYSELKKVIETFNMSIYYYIKLYEKYENQYDLQYIRENVDKLIPKKNNFNGQYCDFYKALYFLKPNISEFSLYDSMHNKIVKVLKIGKGARAEKITDALFLSFRKLCLYLYSNVPYSNNDIIEIFDDVFFALNNHNGGSAQDCDYHTTVKIVYSMITDLCQRDQKLKEIIFDHYLEINKVIKRYIIWEFMPIFVDLKEKTIEFFKTWYDENGYLWTYDNQDIYYIGNKIVETLSVIGFKEESIKLKSIILYRNNLGFVNHKDYSLSQLNSWYKKMESFIDEKIVEKYSTQLLAINDYASSNGDNRYASTVEKTVIKNSLIAGPISFDAVYSTKNNPNDFYYWRKNTSEVIANLSDKKYDPLTELLDKWNIHKKNNETIFIDDWINHIHNSWSEFIKLMNIYEKNENKYSKNELIVYLKEYIPKNKVNEFYNEIVRNIVINRSEYGYEYNYLDNVIEKYCDVIPIEDYHQMINCVLQKVLQNEYFYYIQHDLDLLTRCMMYSYYKTEYELEFDNIILMFKMWIGSPDFINLDTIKFKRDPNISSFQLFVNKQLCRN